MTIKAIETEYNGYKFRSRLEARWAVFFDAAGIKYEYEPEGFDLGDGVYYLPDFLLHDIYGRHRGKHCGPADVWVEVKGNMTDYDEEKINRFSGFHELKENNWDNETWERVMKTYPSLYVVGDIPNPNKTRWCDNCVEAMLDEGCDSNMFNCETIDGDYFGLAICVDVDGKAWLEDANYNMGAAIDHKKTDAAFKKARQARFEHGETPVIRHD